MNFLETIDSRIQAEMAIRATSDQRILTGLRNIKSEFSLAKSRNTDATDISIIQKMAKTREETAKLYENVNQDLWLQEKAELEILTPFLPKPVNKQEVLDFLGTLKVEKVMKNFRTFKLKAEENFGQEIDSAIISEFLKS